MLAVEVAAVGSMLSLLFDIVHVQVLFSFYRVLSKSALSLMTVYSAL